MSAYRSSGSKCRFLGTIWVNLLMYPDENLPLKRVNAPHLDAIRVQRSTSITYARSNHNIRQGVWATHGPNAPKRRYLGTISAKLLMYLDENLPPEGLNAPHLDAIRVQRSTSITYARSNHYVPGFVGNPRAKCSQEEVPRHHFSQAADVPR